MSELFIARMKFEFGHNFFINKIINNRLKKTIILLLNKSSKMNNDLKPEYVNQNYLEIHYRLQLYAEK